MRRRIYIFDFSSQENSFSLGHWLRFYDIGSCFSLRLGIKIRFEISIFEWKVPSQWKKWILLWSFLAKLHEVLSEHILPREDKHSWEMVDLLVMLHFHQSLWKNVPICPPNIPLRIILISLNFPFKFFRNFRQYFICAIYIKRFVPETLIIIRSKRKPWAQFGVNFGAMG